MSKHTSGQWYWNSYDGIFCGDVNKKEKVDLIATVSHLGDKGRGDEIHGKRAEEAIDNAQFIVKACNNHYKLLEACKISLKIAEAGNPFDIESTDLLKQAISKTEE